MWVKHLYMYLKFYHHVMFYFLLFYILIKCFGNKYKGILIRKLCTNPTISSAGINMFSYKKLLSHIETLIKLTCYMIINSRKTSFQLHFIQLVSRFILYMNVFFFCALFCHVFCRCCICIFHVTRNCNSLSEYNVLFCS